MTLPAYMPTGFLLKSAAVNVYLDSGFAKAGNVMTFILVSKGGHPDMTPAVPDMHASRISAENMRHDLELSLRTLGTDYIDIYFYHRDNETIPAGELIEIMEEFRKEGKIRYLCLLQLEYCTHERG